MRLLFIANDFPNPLEPTKAVFNLHLVRALARKHEVQVISPVSWVDELAGLRAGKRLAGDRAAVSEGLSVHHPRYYYPPRILRSRYGWFYWRSIRALVKSLIQSKRPDAVLAYWAHPDGEAALRAGRLAGAACAVIVGGSDVQSITQNAERRRRVGNVLRSIDAVICVNADLKKKVEAFGVDAGRVHVWSQGVDETVFFPADKIESRRKLGMSEGALQMLWVGRMVQVKGLEVLLNACAALRNRKISFHLHLIGDGPLRAAVTAQADRLGLTDAISFVGIKKPEQLGDWYRAADLFVMSSWSEGLPNVLREALACGTPFVASDVGGISEIAGESNALFPAGDAAAMAERIASFAEGTRINSVAGSPSTWDESAGHLVEILQSIKPRPAPLRESGRRLGIRQLVRGAMSALLRPGIFLTRGPTDSGAVCLTFDDGPDPVQTPRILDVLAGASVKATFFVLGEQAEKYPQIIRRIVAEGHTLGQHSYLHEYGIRPRQLIDSVRRTRQVLSQITAVNVNLFRPPYGKITASGLFHLWREKQTVVLWNRDAKDYARRSGDEIRNWFNRFPLRSGDIVLLHDTNSHTADALADLIKSVRDKDLEFVTVDRWTSSEPRVVSQLAGA